MVVAQSGRGAMHVEMIRKCVGSGPCSKDDLVGSMALDCPSRTSSSSTELPEAPEGPRSRPSYHGGDSSVGSEHHVVRFEAFVRLLRRLRRDHRLELQDGPRKGALAWLEERSIEDP